ncbi:MAG: hypothetical protein EPO36_03670 [Chloroflexota bacterium]|nr:MAG: hypothetical protein EPO36_03670 [Chloroflexota bacterium]
MNQHSDIDRLLRHWMDDGPTTMPDRIIDVVADRISVQRQRRSWRLLRRLPMNPIVKLGTAAAAVLVVAVVGYNLLPRQGGVGGPTTPLPTASPTAIPTSSPVASGPVDLRSGILSAGRYRMDLSFIDPGLSIVANIPEGWVGHPEIPALTSPAGSNEGVLIGFMQADRLFSDACHWDLDGTGSPDQQGDVVVGPSAADLVSALQANTSYTTSGHEPTSIGGFQARALELHLPGGDVISACDRRSGESTGDYFVFPGGFYAQGPNSRWHLHIIEIDGTRLITMISIAEGTSEAEFAVAEAIAMSFEITP